MSSVVERDPQLPLTVEPVGHDGDWGCLGFFTNATDEESLAFARHGVALSARVILNGSLEQRDGGSMLEAPNGFYRYGHQLPIRGEVEELPAIAAPARL